MIKTWDDEEKVVLAISAFVSACLSTAGSVFIFIAFFAMFRTRSKKIIHRLVLYLSLCHFLLSVSLLVVGPFEDSSITACHIIAPIRFYLFLATFVWTCTIATEMVLMWYRASVNQFGELVMPQTISLRQELGYHFAAWSIPLAITIWPAFFHHDDEGLWRCWFEDARWTYVFISCASASWFYCIVVYCLALFKFRVQVYESGGYSNLQEGKRTELKFRVTGYLLAFFVTWMPLTVLQIMESIDSSPSTPMFVFTVISSTLVPLTGFLDSLIYGWDRKLWDTVVRFLICRRSGSSRVGLLYGGDNQYSINGLPWEDTEETLALSD